MAWTVKEILATAAVTMASVLSVTALLIPPQGEIDASVLYVVAQFLLFSGTMLGVDVAVERIRGLMRGKK